MHGGLGILPRFHFLKHALANEGVVEGAVVTLGLGDLKPWVDRGLWLLEGWVVCGYWALHLVGEEVSEKFSEIHFSSFTLFVYIVSYNYNSYLCEIESLNNQYQS